MPAVIADRSTYLSTYDSYRHFEQGHPRTREYPGQGFSLLPGLKSTFVHLTIAIYPGVRAPRFGPLDMYFPFCLNHIPGISS